MRESYDTIKIIKTNQSITNNWRRVEYFFLKPAELSWKRPSTSPWQPKRKRKFFLFFFVISQSNKKKMLPILIERRQVSYIKQSAEQYKALEA